MKKNVDSKCKEVEYKVGEMVFLKLRPYRQTSLWKKRNEKLSPKFFGPYEVLEQIGLVAYKLRLPDTTTIHLVFHVSQLKTSKGECQQIQTDMIYLTDNHKWQAEPKESCGYLKKKGNSWKVLIQWKGLPKHEATWEDYDEIQQRYPQFHLEDKVNIEECNDRPSTIHQYSRRKKKS